MRPLIFVQVEEDLTKEVTTMGDPTKVDLSKVLVENNESAYAGLKLLASTEKK